MGTVSGLCYDARVINRSRLRYHPPDVELNSLNDRRKSMRQAVTSLGLALALVFLSVYTPAASGASEKISPPKLLAFYYHADW